MLEADCYSSGQEIFCVLWNQNIHYCIWELHIELYPESVKLSPLAHTPFFSGMFNLMLSFHTHFLLVFMHDTCPASLFFLHFINLLIGKDYKCQSYSHASSWYFHSHQIFSSALCSQTPSDSSKFTFKNLCLDINDVFCFVGGDSIKVDESLFQDLEELDLDADEVLDDDSS